MTDDRHERRLAALVREHQAALCEFCERAESIDEPRWLVPRAEGKWTPAQETRHLILAYEAFCRDLNGEAPLRLRGNPLRRALWRLIGLTSILWRKRIPVAVRAPREARPDWETTPRDPLVAQLRQRGGEFDTMLARIWRSEPRRRLTHPLFGAISLDQAIRLCAVHTRHHAAFLPASQVAHSL
jgi:hypothetical protein